jgi:hypothetical protein
MEDKEKYFSPLPSGERARVRGNEEKEYREM